MIYIIGPGHGGPALVAQAWLEGTYSEIYPDIGLEKGTTTTPFDMVVLNQMDRYHLVMDVIDRVLALGPRAAYATQELRDKLVEHRQYIREHGEDMPDLTGWRWGRHESVSGGAGSTEADNA